VFDLILHYTAIMKIKRGDYKAEIAQTLIEEDLSGLEVARILGMFKEYVK
jgi:hypothetical protein